MQQLLEILKKIEALEIETAEYLNTNIPWVSDVQELACSVLIDNNGKNKWENIESLGKNGFAVFPLEKDRFGWVIGGISTKKGIIAFG